MAYHVQPASGVKNLHTTIGSGLPSCEYSAGSFFSRSFVKSFIGFHLLSASLRALFSGKLTLLSVIEVQNVEGEWCTCATNAPAGVPLEGGAGLHLHKRKPWCPLSGRERAHKARSWSGGCADRSRERRYRGARQEDM